MTRIPEPVPPLPRDHGLRRDLPASAAFAWLAAGWADFKVNPGPSLVYGLAVFIVSLTIVAGMFERSEEHTSELQSLMRISYAVFCLKKKNHTFQTLLPKHKQSDTYN